MGKFGKVASEQIKRYLEQCPLTKFSILVIAVIAKRQPWR